MSVVTNVMLQFDKAAELDDTGTLEKVQEIVMRLCEQRFKSLTRNDARFAWGGSKNPECDLHAGAFNYFPLTEFMEELAKIHWDEPDRLRVFVQGQDDETFGVWVLREGVMVCVLDPCTESGVNYSDNVNWKARAEKAEAKANETERRLSRARNDALRARTQFDVNSTEPGAKALDRILDSLRYPSHLQGDGAGEGVPE